MAMTTQLREAPLIDVTRLSPTGGEAILYRPAANTYQHFPGVPMAGSNQEKR